MYDIFLLYSASSCAWEVWQMREKILGLQPLQYKDYYMILENLRQIWSTNRLM